MAGDLEADPETLRAVQILVEFRGPKAAPRSAKHFSRRTFHRVGSSGGWTSGAGLGGDVLAFRGVQLEASVFQSFSEACEEVVTVVEMESSHVRTVVDGEAATFRDGSAETAQITPGQSRRPTDLARAGNRTCRRGAQVRGDEAPPVNAVFLDPTSDGVVDGFITVCPEPLRWATASCPRTQPARLFSTATVRWMPSSLSAVNEALGIQETMGPGM